MNLYDSASESNFFHKVNREQKNDPVQDELDQILLNNQDEVYRDPSISNFVIIGSELFDRLVKIGLFKQIGTQRGKVSVELDSDQSRVFLNGIVFAKYLLNLKEVVQRSNQDFNIETDIISSLKDINSAQTRLYNWNSLIAQLDKIGIIVEYESKHKLVNGQTSEIEKLFERIDNYILRITNNSSIDNLLLPFSDGRKPQKDLGGGDGLNGRRGIKPHQRKQVKDGVDIMKMDTNKEPSDAESSLEFILNTLCRALSMKPKQAAALLTNNNQFLVHCAVKGVKGNFQAIINWYNEVYLYSRHLSQMVEIEVVNAQQSQDQALIRTANQNFDKVLQTISCGCYSQNIEVARICLRTLSCISQDLSQNLDVIPLIMKWFESKDNGIYTINYALKKHSSLAQEFVDCVGSFTGGGEQMSWTYMNILQSYYPDTAEYVECLNQTLPFLVAQYRDEVAQGQLLTQMIEKCIRYADNDPMNSETLRIAAIGLLVELWIGFTDEIDQSGSLLPPIHHLIKKNCRERSRSLRLVTAAGMFKLLDKFSDQKNQSAPLIFKSLIFSLVENPQDQVIRELFLKNFQNLFERVQSIPIGLLLDPFIKSNQIQDTFEFQVFDYDFLIFISRHQKLQLSNSIQIMDLLARQYLNDLNYATAVSVPFMIICSRFIEQPECQEFIQKFVTICLNQLVEIDGNFEKSAPANPKGRLLALPPAEKKVQKDFLINSSAKKNQLKEITFKPVSTEETVNNRIKKSLIVTILLKIQNLRQEEVNNNLKDLLLKSQKQYKELNDGFLCNGIMAVLKYYDDPDSLFNQYMQSFEVYHDPHVGGRKMLGYESDPNAQNYESAPELAVSKSKKTLKASAHRSSTALVPVNENQHNLRALHELEMIKKFKKDKEIEERLKQEKLMKKQSMVEEKLKEELKKRRVDLGIAQNKGGVRQELKALIYSEQEAQNPKIKNERAPQSVGIQIQLIDLNQEEERDKEIVKEFLKRNRRIWKSLFQRYSNQAYSSKGKQGFDDMKNKVSQISLAEITKMLRDHNTYPALISKDEIAHLIRLINMSSNSENAKDLTMLDYEQFQIFIPQLALLCFSRPPQDKSHFPPVESLVALVNTFEQAMRESGKSTVLYEDPDASPFLDKELIQGLEKKLASDPNAEVPEGFRKELQKIPCYQYKIPMSAKSVMKPSQIVATELMDELLFKILDIHFLEPIVHFETKIKVKQAIANNKKPTQQHAYMQTVTKKDLLKKQEQAMIAHDSITSSSSKAKAVNSEQKRQDNLEVRPKISLALKLQVTKQDLKNRPHWQEVAEVLEEILQATEKGMLELPPRLNRAPGQVQNEAKQIKAQQDKEELEKMMQKEAKRKERDAELKAIISESGYGGRLVPTVVYNKQQKELEEKQKQKQEKDQRKEFQKAAQEQRQVVDKLRSDKMMEQQKAEEEKRKKEEAEKKEAAKARKEFLNSAKKNLESKFQETYKNRDEVILKQEEQETLRREAEHKLKDQMSMYIQSTKQDREIEKKERQDVVDFINRPDVAATFEAYSNPLNQIFKFFAAQDNKKDHSTFELEYLHKVLSFKEMVRFGYQMDVTPILISPEDMVYIFKNLVREQSDNNKQKDDSKKQGSNMNIDFEGFKKAIVRIVIMAQEKLLNQNQQDGKSQRGSVAKNTTKEEQKKQNFDKLKEQFKLEQEYKEQQLSKQATLKKDSSTAKISEFGKRKEEERQRVIDEAKLRQEEEFFHKWLKQRENLGLVDIPEKQEGELGKTIAEAKQQLQKRKDLSQKEMDELNRQMKENEAKLKLKVENKQVRKQLDINLITPEALVAFLDYLDLDPSDNLHSINQKLNNSAINRKVTMKEKTIQDFDQKVQARLDETKNATIKEQTQIKE